MLNFTIGSKKISRITKINVHSYDFNRIYLPKFNSPFITSKYLLGVPLRKVFGCMSSVKRISYMIGKETKIDMYKEFSHILR